MNTPTVPPFALIPLAAHHSAATLAWMNDPALMPLLNRLRLITTEEHAAWFARLAHCDDLACFAIESGPARTHLGNVWLHAIDRTHRKAEVRIMLDPARTGAGLGSAALARLAAHAFGPLRLHRLYAHVLENNLRAQAAFKRAGFTVEGRLVDDRWTGTAHVSVILVGLLAT